MIEAWFNERGYRVVTSKGESRFVYDLPSDITDNAARLYAARWMVLNQMLDAVNELRETIEDLDLALYTDSRLIEELKGEITPNSRYAQHSLRHFIENDYVKFRRVAFHKCASTVINGKLSEPVLTPRLENT